MDCPGVEMMPAGLLAFGVKVETKGRLGMMGAVLGYDVVMGVCVCK